MNILRSIILNIYFVIVTVLIGVCLSPACLFGARAALVVVCRPWAYAMIYGAKYISGITFEVRGEEHMRAAPCLVASKHQSAWETIAFLFLISRPCFVLKQELLLVPVVGLYFKALKCVMIDRSKGSKAIIHMAKQAKARVLEKRNIIIFPEGTRTKVGEEGEYFSGVAALYSKCDVPVVPVAHNAGQCWPKNSFIKRPGKIIVQFLPAIEAATLRRDQLVDQLKITIEASTRALEAEGRALMAQKKGAKDATHD